MDLMKKLMILYYFFVITGCSVIIDSIVPGTVNSEKTISQDEPILNDEMDLSPEITPQKTDTNETLKYIDSHHTSKPEEIFPIETSNQVDLTILDSNNNELQNVQKDNSDETYDKPNPVLKTPSLKTVSQEKKRHENITLSEISPVCSGEKVSKHWHDLKTVVVVTDFLNIRSRYGSNQPVIDGAKRCEQLIVIDKYVERIKKNKGIRSRGWLKIKTQSGTTGWVAGWLTRSIKNN